MAPKRRNMRARKRILNVLNSREFKENRALQKELFDDLRKKGLDAGYSEKYKYTPDRGASQFWYDVVHKRGKVFKDDKGVFFHQYYAIDRELKADNLDYRKTSEDLGQRNIDVLLEEHKRGVQAGIKQEVDAIDRITGAKAVKEAIKGKADEIKEKVEQAKKVISTTEKAARYGGAHIDEATGKNKVLKENQAFQKALKRERKENKTDEKPADVDVRQDQQAQAEKEPENAGKDRQADSRETGVPKNSGDNQGNVIDEAGRKIPASEFEKGDTIVSKNGDEYEKRNGKWEKTGENYGTYNPPQKQESWKNMTPKERHEALKNNNDKAWKKVGDALKSGDPEKIKEAVDALGAKSSGNDDDRDKLRNAETGTGKGRDTPNQRNIDLAKKMASNTSGAALQDNDARNNQDTRDTRRVASITQSERATGAQAQGNAEQNRIDTAAQAEEHALSHEADTHQSTESAADVERKQPTVMGAIGEGLISGAAQGVDRAFGRFGRGVGEKVSQTAGISRPPRISKPGKPARTGSATRPAPAPAGGCHCTHKDGRCHMGVSPDSNHDGCCDMCGCPVKGGGRQISRKKIKPRKPGKKRKKKKKRRHRGYSVVSGSV